MLFGKSHEADPLKNQRTFAWIAVWFLGFIMLNWFLIVWFGDSDIVARAEGLTGYVAGIIALAITMITNYGVSARDQVKI